MAAGSRTISGIAVLLRLTPVLAIMVLFHLTLFKYMGSGPFWPSTVSVSVGACESDWWKTLLYIQNYDNRPTCIPQAWYVSVDTQLFLLSPLLLLPLTIWPRITLIGTAVLTVISMIACFITGWIYELNGQFLGYISNFSLFEVFFLTYYATPHTRASVWLIGIIYGYLAFKVNEKNCALLFNKVVIGTLWFVSLTVLCTCLFAGHDLIVEPELDKVANSIFLTLVRPAWGIAVGWIIFACFKGYGGPVNWFLSLRVFETLEKLNYTMYLVHYSVINIRLGQQRAPMVFSNYTEMYVFWGDFAFTLFFSLILYLAIEHPVVLIEQQLLANAKGNTEKKQQNAQNHANKCTVDGIKQP